VGDITLWTVASANVVAEQVTAQCEHDGEDENPHQSEETEAEHEKG
jgi:hypothetical protein